ncbi:MAG: sigma-70 family RNA polymerase sigma factor [Clostridiales bacterium]|nr:sigma-70 family RNA polymerase sigma factor [Clostridiales bacterium]
MSKFSQKNDNEGSILSYAQSGNKEHLASAVHRYTALVENIALKYRDSQLEKDDLMQEGMIGLLAAIKTFDNTKGTQFKTYAATCIDNAMQSALRKCNRKKDIPPQNVVEYQEEEIPEIKGSVSAEDMFIAQESVSLLTEALRKNLSDFENEVLRLHIVGCSYNEIAKRLCKTPKAVDNALQRIRRKLATFSL